MSTTVVHDLKHVVAIIGGAIAGSTAAQILADAGVIVVVLEQNIRPYGKIEDGLPRWHTKQRLMEYERINSRLEGSTAAGGRDRPVSGQGPDLPESLYLLVQS